MPRISFQYFIKADIWYSEKEDCVKSFCICDKKECIGCGLCAALCPRECIEIKLDDDGFSYPHIKEEKCIHCEKCKMQCPANHTKNALEAGQAYMCFMNDTKELLKSSSGGVATVLGRKVIDSGGCVFGCSYTDDFCNAYFKINVI